ncbi:MAG: hypothetical protein L6Q77_06230 [Bacteroidetes bacterium]|nr:hypothetical protein [Bacteroidota bacterium]
MTGRIDFHTHIIPGVDDGAPDVSVSVEMARQAVSAGVTTLVGSVHLNRRTWTAEFDRSVSRAHENLQTVLSQNNLALQVSKGYEVAIDRHLAPLGDVFHAGLAGTSFLLVELPMMGTPLYFLDEVFELHVKKYRVIIAHPERCIDFNKKKSEFSRAAEMGAFFQLDAGSITGQFGPEAKKAAFWFLENQLAHFLCSDAHSVNNRSYRVYEEAIRILDREFGEDVSALLTVDNPARLLNGQTDQICAPAVTRTSFLSRLFKRKYTS